VAFPTSQSPLQQVGADFVALPPFHLSANCQQTNASVQLFQARKSTTVRQLRVPPPLTIPVCPALPTFSTFLSRSHKLCSARRLQPSAIVTDEDCAACSFNRPGKTCLRQMQWVWRGETFACDSREYHTVKNQLASEPLPPETEGGPHRAFDQLPYEERQKLLKARLKLYTQKVTF